MFSTRQIREIIRENNLSIHKYLGQNFLVDKRIRDRIVAVCGLKKEDVVLEIGPGLGALTESILALCKRLIAVEKDKGLSIFLISLLGGSKNLDIVNKDILRYDLTLPYKKQKKKIRVIGNLPFYITSPIIFYLLKYKKYIDSAFITVQKEVAERIVATPGGKDYGLLSCSVQYHCQPEIVMRISKAAFFPRPEVDASLLKLHILKEPCVKVKNEQLFFNIIKAAFCYRRKTLLNAIAQSPTLRINKDKLKNTFDKLGFDSNLRGERLGLQKFALLTEELDKDVP